jgi:hypothetical protein
VLLTFPALHTLSLKGCDAGNAICEFIPLHRSLLKVHLGNSKSDSENCGVTDAGVSILVGSGQLADLNLSTTPLTQTTTRQSR